MDAIQSYTDFFSRFVNKYNQRYPTKAIKVKPTQKNWMKIGAPGYPPGAGYHLSFTNDGRFRVEITFQSADRNLNKFVYDVLLQCKEDIEQQVGAPLEWERKDEAKRAQISWYYPRISDDKGSSSLEERYLEWVVPNAERFQSVINKFLRAHS